jgi:hypothetical protein
MQARGRGRVCRPVGVTCSSDQRRHLVDDVTLTTGREGNDGRFQALCGHTVLAASLADPPGRDCPLCEAVHTLARPDGRERRPARSDASPVHPLRRVAGALFRRPSPGG